MADATIITGQYVRINQTVAGMGERFAARLIDWIVQGLYLYGMFSLLQALSGRSFSYDTSFLEYDTAFFIFYLPVLLYDPLCETLNQGQSLGKKLMNIRVVMADGSTPSMSAYVLRWLLYPIDSLLCCFGICVILLSKHNQRIGDLAAGTVVIRLNNYRKINVSLDEFSHLYDNYQPVYKQAVDLSPEQANVIEKVLAVNDSRRPQFVAELSQKVKRVLAVTPKQNDEDFLQTVLHDFQYYTYVDV